MLDLILDTKNDINNAKAKRAKAYVNAGGKF